MSEVPPRPTYAFGDSPLAADRLALVARVFAASSRAFLAETVDAPPALALDLGCGPGHSTRLVAETTRAHRTLGIDRSPAFLERAGAGAIRDIEFVAHDVTELPLPGAPADLVYARLVLAHLPDPARQAAAWTTQLAADGVLLLDEVEWIETSHPVLAHYEELVLEVVAAHGGASYAGPIIDAMPSPEGVARARSDLRLVAVTTADAARMYGMNLANWRDDPHIAQRCTADELDGLAARLVELARDARGSDITWGIRQIAFRRAA